MQFSENGIFILEQETKDNAICCMRLCYTGDFGCLKEP